jgi:DNA-binding response OmpR family regulator
MSNTARILIIEDSLLFQKTLKKRLESRGYQTMIADDGLEGLALVKREKPDLVILDLMLPGMDGHKICRLLKFDRETRDIPIVLFTSRDLAKDVELARQCHADAFIVKTIGPEAMMDVIQKLLKRREATEQTSV